METKNVKLDLSQREIDIIKMALLVIVTGESDAYKNEANLLVQKIMAAEREGK